MLIIACEDVSEVWQGRFWELVPGQAVGSLSIRVKPIDTELQSLLCISGG
jgi:hypothetical protein